MAQHPSITAGIAPDIPAVTGKPAGSVGLGGRRRRRWLARVLSVWVFATILLATAAALPVLFDERDDRARRAVQGAVIASLGQTAAVLAPAWTGFVHVNDALNRSDVRFQGVPPALALAVDTVPLTAPLLGIRVQDLNGQVVAEKVAGDFDFPSGTELFGEFGETRLRAHTPRAGLGGARIVPFSLLSTDRAGRPMAVVVYVDAAPLAAAFAVIPGDTDVTEPFIVTDQGTVLAAGSNRSRPIGTHLGFTPPAGILLSGEVRTFFGRLRPDRPNQAIAYARVPNWPLLAIAGSTNEWVWLTGGHAIGRMATLVSIVLAAIAALALLVGHRWRGHLSSLDAARRRTRQVRRTLQATDTAVISWRPGGSGVYFSDRWKRMLGLADDEIGDQLEELLERVHANDKPAVLRDLHALVTGATTRSRIIYRLSGKDGTTKQVLQNSTAEVGPDGHVTSVILTQLDLTGLATGAPVVQSAIQSAALVANQPSATPVTQGQPVALPVRIDAKPPRRARRRRRKFG